jgi:starch synthase
LNVLYATPECAPLVKTGGLGDVSAALPAALRAIGIDARVLLPGYPAVLAANPQAAELAHFSVLGQPVRILDARLPGGVPLLVVDCPALYVRPGGPYQADDGSDWNDNALRFGVLSKAAAMLASDASPLDWRVDVVHCNDWQTALAPLYMRFDAGRRRASLVTIHNLAFQGVYHAGELGALGLPPAALGIEGLEYYGRMSLLKGGLVYADAINTVSPSYAREIQGPELGFGMDGVLRHRSARLFGVLNGIDTAVWNPETDPLILSRYGADSLDRKAPNKMALKERLGIAGPSDRPLLGIVSRLTHQKGIDLILEAAERLMRAGAQFAIVGTGERELVTRLVDMQSRHRHDFGVFIGFDEQLAHLLEAGSDMFLMPSRFEPCGMNQMYSQRYGTPPVANATGGLLDTVTDEAMGSMSSTTGYLMKSATADQLAIACQRAIADWRNPDRWRAIQRNGMAHDFGWSAAAREYAKIYAEITR